MQGSSDHRLRRGPQPWVAFWRCRGPGFAFGRRGFPGRAANREGQRMPWRGGPGSQCPPPHSRQHQRRHRHAGNRQAPVAKASARATEPIKPLGEAELELIATPQDSLPENPFPIQPGSIAASQIPHRHLTIGKSELRVTSADGSPLDSNLDMTRSSHHQAPLQGPALTCQGSGNRAQTRRGGASEEGFQTLLLAKEGGIHRDSAAP